MRVGTLSVSPICVARLAAWKRNNLQQSMAPFAPLPVKLPASGLTDFFFVRYSDPRRDIRLRFRGEPTRLLTDLLPRVMAWATDLTSSGVCHRFLIRHLRPRVGSLRWITTPRCCRELLLRRQCCCQRPLGILSDRTATHSLHDIRRDPLRIRLELAATVDLVHGALLAAA